MHSKAESRTRQRLLSMIWTMLAFGLSTSQVLAQGRVYEWSWEMHPMWWGWGLGIMLIVFLFWGLVIIGLILGIRWLLGQGRETRPDSALEILRQRYARGEINKEEFEAKKRDLS